MEECEERLDFTSWFWEYYRMLESDCLSLKRYINFQEENMSVSSDEIIKQILSVSAEFDNVCREITGIRKEKPSIVDYGKWFFSEKYCVDLLSVKVRIRITSIELTPFDGWGRTAKDRMAWWDAYNKIKHNRDKNYMLGNLGNLLKALSALYYLEKMQYKIISTRNSKDGCIVFDIPPDRSELFEAAHDDSKYIHAGHDLYALTN